MIAVNCDCFLLQNVTLRLLSGPLWRLVQFSHERQLFHIQQGNCHLRLEPKSLMLAETTPAAVKFYSSLRLESLAASRMDGQ